MIYILVVSSIRKASLEEGDDFPVLIKMLTTHIQVSSRVGSAIRDLPQVLMSFFEYQNVGSSVGSPNLAFLQCELQSTAFKDLMFVLMMPAIILVLFLFIMSARTLMVWLTARKTTELIEQFDPPAEDCEARRATVYGDEDVRPVGHPTRVL